MKILRTASTAVAISIAGAGITLGGIGLATADDSTADQSSTTQVNPAPGPGEGRGPQRGGPGGPGELAAGLAEALGLQESDVLASMQAVHDELGPEVAVEAETRTPPTQAEQEAHRAEMTSALAEDLGVSEQKLTDALDSMAAEHEAAARSDLAGRLDAAVADGDLTKTDKESVLKAFDAGVLEGPRGPGPA